MELMQHEISDTFAANLQRLRKRKDFTQQQLADKLDVPRSRVGSWEEQRAFPSLADLFKICRLFKLTVEQIAQSKV